MSDREEEPGVEEATREGQNESGATQSGEPEGSSSAQPGEASEARKDDSIVGAAGPQTPPAEEKLPVATAEKETAAVTSEECSAAEKSATSEGVKAKDVGGEGEKEGEVSESKSEGAEGSGGQGAAKDEEQRPEPVHISYKQQLLVSRLNTILNNEPQPDPNLLLRFRPDSFSEDLRQALEEVLGDEAADLDTTGMAATLQPICEKLHRLLRAQASRRTAHSGATAAGGSGGGGGGGDSNASAAAAGTGGGTAARSGGLQQLPQRSVGLRGSRARARAGGAAAGGDGRSAAAEAWTGLSGPNESDAIKKFRASVQELRVSLIRCFTKLSYPATNPMLRQLLHRLEINEQQLAPFPSSRPSAKELAAQTAKDLEAQTPPAPFSERFVVCLLGLQGAGKTSTINRLMGKDATDPFKEDTRGGCKIIDADLHGIPFRFIDTPGLEIGTEAERANKRKLDGILKCTRKRCNKPHVWVYVDRMDAMRSPNVDVSIVRTIFENLPDALFKTHIAMTHAACKPPDTSSGPVPYEEWNAQRQNILRSVFSHTTGDQSSQWLCLLVENHHRCRTNAVGEPVLPNGVTWRPQFLAGICVATHGAKASGLRAPGARKATNPVERQQDMVRRLMQQTQSTFPLGYLLSSATQPKQVLKPPADEHAVPSPLEIRALSKEDANEARKAHKSRLEYIAQKAAEAEHGESPVPMFAPLPPLAPTMEVHENKYRYRYQECMGGWTVRPYVDANGPDKSDGINGGQSSKDFVFRRPKQHIGGVLSSLVVQSVKDKVSRTLLVASESTTWLDRNRGLTFGVGYQTIGPSEQLTTIRLEPRVKYGRFRGRRRLKTGVGLYHSRMTHKINPLGGDVGARGLRLEQRVRVTEALKVILTGAAMGTVGSSRRETGRARGVDISYKPKDHVDGREIMVGWNTSTVKARGPNGRVLGANSTSGGTIAVSTNLTRHVTMSTRMTLSAAGQHTLTMRLVGQDEQKLRFGLLVPLVAWVADKASERGAEPF